MGDSYAMVPHENGTASTLWSKTFGGILIGSLLPRSHWRVCRSKHRYYPDVSIGTLPFSWKQISLLCFCFVGFYFSTLQFSLFHFGLKCFSRDALRNWLMNRVSFHILICNLTSVVWCVMCQMKSFLVRFSSLKESHINKLICRW